MGTKCDHKGTYKEGGRRVRVREKMMWQQKQRSRLSGAVNQELWTVS